MPLLVLSLSSDANIQTEDPHKKIRQPANKQWLTNWNELMPKPIHSVRLCPMLYTNYDIYTVSACCLFLSHAFAASFLNSDVLGLFFNYLVRRLPTKRRNSFNFVCSVSHEPKKDTIKKIAIKKIAVTCQEFCCLS